MINYEDLYLGDKIYVVVDFINYAKFFDAEVVKINENEIHIATYQNSKSTGTSILYKGQSNTFILKDKKMAWLVFLAKNYKGTNLEDHYGVLRADILKSISQFPELWI